MLLILFSDNSDGVYQATKKTKLDTTANIDIIKPTIKINESEHTGSESPHKHSAHRWKKVVDEKNHLRSENTKVIININVALFHKWLMLYLVEGDK